LACHPVSGTYDYLTFAARGQGLGGTGTDLYGAYAEALVRNISTCSSPGPGEDTVDFVLPANVQYTPNQNDIVQVGYMRCGAPAGESCGDPNKPIPNDGSLHFVYMCSDHSGGMPCNAGAWAGLPVLGHRYSFEIVGQANGTWYHSIRDISAGTVAKTTTIPRTWTNGDGVWWGGETYDSNSMLGPTDLDTQVKMYPLEYLRVSIGWSIAHPVTIFDQLPIGGSWPSWYRSGPYSQNYTNDAINFWTLSH
jgi:hypothetical protein